MIQIRKMEEKDVAAVWEIERECFSRPWTRQALAAVVSDPGACYLVACDEPQGTVVGYVGAYLILDEADINQVAVAGAARRRGVATRLLADFWQELQTIGIKSVTLEVRAGNTAAIALYEKCGFQKEGERKNFYEAPTENACIMWKR